MAHWRVGPESRPRDAHAVRTPQLLASTSRPKGLASQISKRNHAKTIQRGRKPRQNPLKTPIQPPPPPTNTSLEGSECKLTSCSLLFMASKSCKPTERLVITTGSGSGSQLSGAAQLIVTGASSWLKMSTALAPRDKARRAFA